MRARRAAQHADTVLIILVLATTILIGIFILGDYSQSSSPECAPVKTNPAPSAETEAPFVYKNATRRYKPKGVLYI